MLFTQREKQGGKGIGSPQDTESVSRFARNTVDCLDTVRSLRARGIGVYFEEQNIDTLKSDSEQ